MSGTFDLKLGFRCNNNCKHCVVADKRKTEDLSKEEVFNMMKEIPDPLNTSIQITGGEPTLYDYLPELLKESKERGLFTLIQSNGTGFADEAFLLECSPYIDDVHIAIHSCYPEIHDKIVGTKGMWEKTIKGLDNLIKHKVPITTQTVLSKYNIDSLYDTFSFIQKKKPGVRMSMTYPHMNGNAWKYREEVAFRYSDKREVIQKTLEEFYPFIFSEAIPYCHLHPYAHLVESMERDIFEGVPREGIDCSFSKEAVKDYNYLNLEDHRKTPYCRKCMYDEVCIGVWKEYIELYKDEMDLYPIGIEEGK